MKSKQEGMIKGFSQLSRTKDAETNLKNANYVDEITFGFYSPEGDTTGEMSIEWIYLDGKIVPRLIVYSDAWNALAQFHNLINLLGEHDGEDSTPEEFCKYLLESGFIDIT